jgi:hypothetical protein
MALAQAEEAESQFRFSKDGKAAKGAKAEKDGERSMEERLARLEKLVATLVDRERSDKDGDIPKKFGTRGGVYSYKPGSGSVVLTPDGFPRDGYHDKAMALAKEGIENSRGQLEIAKRELNARRAALQAQMEELQHQMDKLEKEMRKLQSAEKSAERSDNKRKDEDRKEDKNKDDKHNNNTNKDAGQ